MGNGNALSLVNKMTTVLSAPLRHRAFDARQLTYQDGHTTFRKWNGIVVLTLLIGVLLAGCTSFIQDLTSAAATGTTVHQNEGPDTYATLPKISSTPLLRKGQTVWKVSTNAGFRIETESRLAGVPISSTAPALLSFYEPAPKRKLALEFGAVTLGDPVDLSALDGRLALVDGRSVLPTRVQVRHERHEVTSYVPDKAVQEQTRQRYALSYAASDRPKDWHDLLIVRFEYDLPADPFRRFSVHVGTLVTQGREESVSFTFAPVIVREQAR